MESEEPVHEHLAELFERARPDCVLDVGANAGQFGQLLRAHGYDGWIVSFEPGAEAFAELARQAEQDPRWRAFALALGARNERRSLAVTSVTQLSSFRVLSRYGSEEFPGTSEVVGEEEVEIRTLNDCWDELLTGVPSERPFLKLDTQGWDLEVLKGADSLIPRLVGMQLEASLVPIYEQMPTFAETVAYVTALGLGLTGVFPVNRDSRFRLIEADCVFVNPERIEREQTWAMLEGRLLAEVVAAIPEGAELVLIDEGALGLDELAGRRVIPFMDYGRPEHDEHVVAELRSVASRYLVLAWPSFWWLEEYPRFAQRLGSDWRRVSDSAAAIVFELS